MEARKWLEEWAQVICEQVDRVQPKKAIFIKEPTIQEEKKVEKGIKVEKRKRGRPRKS